jgi:hypothetical protein
MQTNNEPKPPIVSGPLKFLPIGFGLLFAISAISTLYVSGLAGCAGDTKGGSYGDPVRAIQLEGYSMIALLVSATAGGAAVGFWSKSINRVAHGGAASVVIIICLWFAGLQSEINGVISCFGNENSTRFSDSHVHKRFVEKLQQSGIKFRESKDQQVFFALEDTPLVDSITADINTEFYPGCGGSFTKKADLVAIEAELKNQNIPFSEVELDSGPEITCAPEHRDKYIQISSQVWSNSAAN